MKTSKTRMILTLLVLVLSLLVLMAPTKAFSVSRPLNSFRLQQKIPATKSSTTALASTATPIGTSQQEDDDEEVDVIVVGAGLGGLSCAALAAKYGLKTLCLEAHSIPGGCAHSFRRYSSNDSENNGKEPFIFDSGPSLVSGLSQKSTNPLRQVLDAVGTADEIDWITYDGWIVTDLDDGKSFKMTTGSSGAFEKAIEQKAGVASRKAFEDFKSKMFGQESNNNAQSVGGLSRASALVPPFALRGDNKAIATIKSYLLKLLSIGLKGPLLTGPFTKCMDLYNLSDPFVRKWFDYLAFALSGEDAAHTQAAPIAYMMADLHKEGAVLDYPRGGMESLVQALVSGLTKHGGELRLNSRITQFILSAADEQNNDNVCQGVVLANGKRIRAKRGVVSNVPLWNMATLLQDSLDKADDESSSPSPSIVAAVNKVQEQANEMYMTGSFMHLHLGIPKDGLNDDEIECHHSVLDLSKDVRDEQNMVIISIPTIFDPQLAPKGYHIVHAYTAACDNFDEWAPFLKDGKESGKVGYNPNSSKASSEYNTDAKYKELKDAKAQVLWRAIETVIPDVRERAQRDGSVVLIGTPLTHRRYNQRFRGTYGPGPAPGKDIWELNGAQTPIKGLLACGDTTFPGIGLPGVAASGTIAANTLVDTDDQLKLMKELREMGALQ